jgi:hypothetical protein
MGKFIEFGIEDLECVLGDLVFGLWVDALVS